MNERYIVVVFVDGVGCTLQEGDILAWFFKHYPKSYKYFDLVQLYEILLFPSHRWTNQAQRDYMAFRHHPPHSSWCFIYSCNVDNPDYRIISQNCLVSSCVSVCQALTPSSSLPAKLSSVSHPLKMDSDLTSFEKPSWMPPCNSHSIVGALSDLPPPNKFCP